MVSPRAVVALLGCLACDNPRRCGPGRAASSAGGAGMDILADGHPQVLGGR